MCCISINTTAGRMEGSTVKDNQSENNTQPNEGIIDLVFQGLLKLVFTVTHILTENPKCMHRHTVEPRWSS